MDNIKDEKIRPISRWQVVTKNFFLLFLAILLVVLGVLATSFVFYSFDYADWDVYRRLPWRDFWWASFGSLPYIWLVLFGLFTFFAVRQFRKQGRAYRYSIFLILGPIFVISVIGGAVAYYSGLQSVMRKNMSPAFQFSPILFPHPTFIWERPDDGRLSGVIVSRKGNVIALVDRFNNVWQVTYVGHRDISDLEGRIKMMGQKTGDFQFSAIEVRELLEGRHEPRFAPMNMPLPVQ